LVAHQEALTKHPVVDEVGRMRTLMPLLAAAVVSVAMVQGQDAGTQSSMDAKATPKGAELLTTPSNRPLGPLRFEQTPITYGGFLVDLTKAESPRRTFSMRQPIDHKSESPNLFRDSVNGRARGFVLFAIRF
jgi:hypothetical protein